MVAEMNLQFERAGVEEGVLEDFESYARVVFTLLDKVRENAGIPESEVTLILANDLTATVQERIRSFSDENESFSPERIGGIVAAKNLPQSPDYSSVAIVFDAAWWTVESDPRGFEKTHQLFLIAHELSHPMLQRARHCSGALDGVILPSFTGGEVARSLTRVLADEYRADVIADLIVRQFASAKIEGEVRTAGAREIFGQGHIESASAAVAQAYPLWPDIVQSFREWQIDPSTMWSKIVGNMEQTLTAIVHAQAVADAAKAADEAAFGPTLLDEEPISSMPARRLYLDPIKILLEALRNQPVLPPFHETKVLDAQLVKTGESAFIETWANLGLTIEERENRQWALWVSAPKR